MGQKATALNISDAIYLHTVICYIVVTTRPGKASVSQMSVGIGSVGRLWLSLPTRFEVVEGSVYWICMLFDGASHRLASVPVYGLCGSRRPRVPSVLYTSRFLPSVSSLLVPRHGYISTSSTLPLIASVSHTEACRILVKSTNSPTIYQLVVHVYGLRGEQALCQTSDILSNGYQTILQSRWGGRIGAILFRIMASHIYLSEKVYIYCFPMALVIHNALVMRSTDSNLSVPTSGILRVTLENYIRWLWEGPSEY